MADIADLIERLEATSEGRRDLDAAIECQRRGWRLIEVSDRGGAYSFEHDGTEFVSGPIGAPYYTTSIDAAMTLVPPGCPRSTHDDGGRSPPTAVVIVTDESGQWEKRTERAKAATPALALCIAALKARSTP